MSTSSPATGDSSPDHGRWTIDELARLADLPTRTLREYRRLGLLPPPGRLGRVGVYDAAHLQRLQLIARLQTRGYSLAGIADLINAWTAGESLEAVLGDQELDEPAQAFTREGLIAAATWLADPTVFAAASDTGLLQSSKDQWFVRAPSLLALLSDAVTASQQPFDTDPARPIALTRSQVSSTASASTPSKVEVPKPLQPKERSRTE